MNISRQVVDLTNKGAIIPCPSSVYIDSSVDIRRISPDITIHPGCRITGASTSIGPGCILGEDGPVTISHCQLARKVTLKGGSFSGSVMMEGVRFGPCAHVREGTLMEEHVCCAHSVGLKQTILMPFVTLGSLINFCDCLMSGGKDSKNHGEIGSSYIHFNYTPHKDKATASLIGDVPRGVMLRQSPIFLGGQGGLVGPARIEFGTIIAAGTICRKDILEANKLYYSSGAKSNLEISYDPSIYGDISRVLLNNFIYIGNLHALYHWYRNVRCLFSGYDQFERTCNDSAIHVLNIILNERIKHLEILSDNIRHSMNAANRRHGKKSPDHPNELHKRYTDQWPRLKPQLEYELRHIPCKTRCHGFINKLNLKKKGSYLSFVKNLSADARNNGTSWLQAIVDSIVSKCTSIVSLTHNIR